MLRGGIRADGEALGGESSFSGELVLMGAEESSS